MKREVKEESGLDFEPEGLIAVECHSHYWVRFTLGGRIVGGSLKTPAQADRESIQAKWQPAEKEQLMRTVSHWTGRLGTTLTPNVVCLSTCLPARLPACLPWCARGVLVTVSPPPPPR